MVWDGKMHQSSSTDKWGLPVKPSDNLNNTSTHLGPPPLPSHLGVCLLLPTSTYVLLWPLHIHVILHQPSLQVSLWILMPLKEPTPHQKWDVTIAEIQTTSFGNAQWVKISINSQDLYLCTCRSADPYYCLINRSPQEVLRKIGSAIAQCNEAPHSSKEISSPVFASVANESYIALNFIAVRNSGTNISRVFRMKVVSLSIMYVRERKKLCTRDDNYPMPFLLLLNATPGAEESILSDLLPSMLKSSPFLKWPGQVSFCRHSCR